MPKTVITVDDLFLVSTENGSYEITTPSSCFSKYIFNEISKYNIIQNWTLVILLITSKIKCNSNNKIYCHKYNTYQYHSIDNSKTVITVR